MTLLDYYEPEGSYGSSTTTIQGQSFKTPDDGKTYKLTTAQFEMYYASGTPAYNLVAKLYAHTGTYGNGGTPTGNALATSAAVTSGLSTTRALVTFTFSGAEQYEMAPNTAYFIIWQKVSGDSTIYVTYDAISPAHAGNRSYYSSGLWYASSYDEYFYLNGDELVSGEDFTASATDLTGLKDNITKVYEGYLTKTDLLGLKDLITANIAKTKTVTDKAGLLDNIAAVLAHPSTATAEEIAGLFDTVTAEVAHAPAKPRRGGGATSTFRQVTEQPRFTREFLMDLRDLLLTIQEERGIGA